MREILRTGAPEHTLTLSCNARRQIELLGFETERGYYVNAVDLRFDDERIPTQSFEVWLRIPDKKTVESVRVLPDGAPLAFTLSDGILRFSVPSFELVTMLEILIK